MITRLTAGTKTSLPVKFGHLRQIKSRSARESANGALDDECEDDTTGESVNGALNNKRRSETQGGELQGQELRKQHDHMNMIT